ncbi:P-loop NTPase fold protein [Micromonospora sp. CPCC 206061]|uniref:P-loop NTPase fold protein n=1 Tax=Micromonospora sp. CPCC 206061 TaxID=3122410 RepID=UPI002FEF5A9E
MRRVLDLVATDEHPVVIFVDDLDRCSPSTVAQAIEAINLFLAGQFPNCVFVVAMEPEMIAAHIEVAYQPLVEALTDDDYWGEVRTLGWRFLDKIIQLPISLLALRSDQANEFLGATLVDRFRPTAAGARATAPSTSARSVASRRASGGDNRRSRTSRKLRPRPRKSARA